MHSFSVYTVCFFTNQWLLILIYKQNRLISGAEKNITIQKESINKLQTLITVVRIKIDNGQFEEALDALEVRYSREDAAPEKLQSLAKMSLLAKESELPGMLESLSVGSVVAIMLH